MSHYAIWDDHDYGPNDADKSYVLKEASRKVFMNNWCNPSFGENGQGIYSKFTYNDVDIFLLDDRWFRSNDKTPAHINDQPNWNKRMFGEQQMEWFKNAMRQSQGNSNIHFRIIATGSQVLNPVSPADCFRQFPAEFKEMMDFLQDEKIDGVVFITGDRHLSEINKAERKGTYPLFDVTASPMTAGASNYGNAEKENPSRILSITGKQNYARFTFTGTGPERKLMVEFLGIKGEKLAEWNVSLREISNKK
jgi:alkaline phosphatase D